MFYVYDVSLLKTSHCGFMFYHIYHKLHDATVNEDVLLITDPVNINDDESITKNE